MAARKKKEDAGIEVAATPIPKKDVVKATLVKSTYISGKLATAGTQLTGDKAKLALKNGLAV